MAVYLPPSKADIDQVEADVGELLLELLVQLGDTYWVRVPGQGTPTELTPAGEKAEEILALIRGLGQST
jgi:hypothetical protein